MAEDFGVQGRGAFYDETGTIRDVVQNHLFQVLANLTMEPPVRTDSESIRDEKVKVLKAIPPLDAKQLVRGQFRGYRKEKGVAPDSTGRNLRGAATGDRFLALAGRAVLHPRRQVPAGDLHGGRRPAAPAADDVHGFDLQPNYLPLPHQSRHHVRPRHECDGTGVGDGQRSRGNAAAARIPRADEMDAYERVLGDAMDGDATLFAREDYVEEAWRIVDPVLKAGTPVYEYEPQPGGRPRSTRAFARRRLAQPDGDRPVHDGASPLVLCTYHEEAKCLVRHTFPCQRSARSAPWPNGFPLLTPRLPKSPTSRRSWSSRRAWCTSSVMCTAIMRSSGMS